MGTPLTDLLLSQAALGQVTRGIHNAIAASLLSHPLRHLTKQETKRRFEICVRWFKVLRLEKKFSIDRCVDELPKALVCELDERKYEPHDRAVWMPGLT